MLAVRRRGWLGARLQSAVSRRPQSILRSLSSSPTSLLSDATNSASETNIRPQNPGSFASLARTFSAIEEVKSSRAASVQLLADGYRELLALPTSQELASALYLTASQLAPPYEGVELRFGAKSFVRFLKQLEAETEKDSEPQQTLEKLLATFPDYGQATQALLDTGRILVPEVEEEQGESLSVTDVHDQLMAIAKDEGTGGVARKQQLALKLLQQCR
ncbi:hypothetical protein PHYSODRAFT_535875 [Phytophthora sojae]|uniref:DNA ligase ATP-dependent N-terminal domain-containing protein n=1 Tax=Phytophthora sojae (strain P6497) TaxID=1094619 RepID=G5AIC7_PHYSP|nr:hypothetical protein PHYSODRAFT_535875 [Phytophthora sojae]EGZ04729.1 hypothetical protein PHYSODRAFT_535875 [Phytophthora sojae]|eukprot:XP_009539828.1 hypothetical protein PHYSODRAFT_535875 [Phytophthora sojae]